MSEAIACSIRVVGEVSAHTRDVARERYCTSVTIKVWQRLVWCCFLHSL